MKRAMDRHTAETFSSDSPHFVRPLNTHPNAGKQKQRCSLAKMQKASCRDGLSQGISLCRRDINELVQ